MRFQLRFRWPAALLLAAVAACASRRLPDFWPENSPVSAQVAPGEQADVTRALREEPPAPGSNADGWSGLAAKVEAPADPHAHHHHHHATTKEGSDVAAPTGSADAGSADAGSAPHRAQQQPMDARHDGGHGPQGSGHEHHHHGNH